MAQTILDLFKSKKNEVYVDEASKAFIDSRGLINAPRKAALLASSPTAVGSIVGKELAGTIKGTAYRPTDTIYKNKKLLSKPISLWPGILTGAAYAVDSGDGVEEGESYYVKKSPGEPSFIAKIKQGASNPKEELLKAAGSFLRKPTTTLKEFKDLTGKLGKKYSENYYGAEKSEDRDGKILKENVKFTTHAPLYKQLSNGNWVQDGLEPREKPLILAGKSKFDQITYDILSNKYSDDETVNIEEQNNVSVPYVLITKYPSKSDKIYLPGTISGLSEDLSPEWNDFKYLGSPFKLYRYGGVERSIKFQIKLYYTDTVTKNAMKRNLERLKKLVFPNENISAAVYPNNNGYSPLTFTPNILFLTVNGIYKDVPCVMDSLSVSIADETPWASNNESSPNTPDRKTIGEYKSNPDAMSVHRPFPVTIDVDMSFKIIETLSVKQNEKITTTYELNQEALKLDSLKLKNFDSIPFVKPPSPPLFKKVENKSYSYTYDYNGYFDNPKNDLGTTN